MSKLKLFVLLALLVPSLSFAMTTEDLVVSLKKSPDVLDTKTKEALIEYQIENAAEILGETGVLNSVGTLDPLTFRHLFGVTSEIGKTYPTTASSVTSSTYFSTNLFKGMEHPDVKKLQQFLNAKGYTVAAYGPGSVGQESTYYGPATADAVTRFQEAYASAILVPNDLKFGNGQFLTSTRAKANSIGVPASTDMTVSEMNMSDTTRVSEAIPTFSTNLFTGMEHPDVKRLQQFLNAKGFTVAASGPGSVGQESTYYGPATAAAVTRFQEAYASTILKPHALTQGNGQFLTSTRAQANVIKGGSGGGSKTVGPSSAGASSATIDIKSVVDGYTLTVRVSGSGLVKTNDGQTCSTSICVFAVEKNKILELEAVASTGAEFEEWTNSCRSTRDTCSIRMTRNKSVTANFSSMDVTDSAPNSTDETSGGSSSSSGGSSGGSSSSGGGSTSTTVPDTSSPTTNYQIINGQAYSLTACATEGGVCVFTGTKNVAFGVNDSFVVRSLDGFAGCYVSMFGEDPAIGTVKACYLSVDTSSASTPEPNPTPVNHTLTVAVSGSGSVTGNGINCPSDCTESYTSGTSVTLTATPGSGRIFAGWAGSCTGSSSTCVVSMTAARTASASFTVAPPTPAPAPAPAPTVAGGTNQPTPNTYNPDWEFCSNLFSGGCDFVGLRDVRYGNGSRWVTREYMDTFPGWECHPNTFGVSEQNGDHCEVATISKTGTLAAPVGGMHGNMPSIDLTSIPLGLKGSGSLNIESTSDRGATSDIGAFRVPCKYSHMAFNDPIVYPGQTGASHLHTFFGNTAVTALSNAASLATSGNSTCPGGIANRSSYWVPSMIDTATNKPVVPNGTIWYYKTGYRGVTPSSVQVMPDGLKIIAGSLPTATVAPSAWDANYRWHCETASHEHTNYGLTIPNCSAGDKVAVEVWFPQCWDGVNLDSTNHRSHMAYADNGCPSSHPVPLPELALNISWKVETAGQARNFRLASDMNGNPAGITMHADFFEAWNTDVKQKFTTQCLNQSKDCHAYLLGDGTMLGEEQ